MIRLDVREPKIPLVPGKPQRMVFRIIQSNGIECSLGDLAKVLSVPYQSLWAAVSLKFSGIGTYSEEFHAVLRDVKARSRRRKLIKCPHCNGTGRAAIPATTGEPS